MAMDLDDALASLTARGGFRRTKRRPELGHDQEVSSGTVLGPQDPSGPLGIQGALDAAVAPRFAGAPEAFDEIDSRLAQIILEQRMASAASQGINLNQILSGLTSSAFNFGGTSPFGPLPLSGNAAGSGGGFPGGEGPG